MVSIVVCRCHKQGYLFILRCTATEKVHAILNLWPSADLLLLCISVLKSENTILTIPTTSPSAVRFPFIICICCFQQTELSPASSAQSPDFRLSGKNQTKKKKKKGQTRTNPKTPDRIDVFHIS